MRGIKRIFRLFLSKFDKPKDVKPKRTVRISKGKIEERKN